MRNAVLVVVVSALVVGSWIFMHNGYAAVAILMVGVAGYYAGHHDGKHEQR